MVLLLIISVLPVYAFGRQEDGGRMQVLKGIIRITGNEPHTVIILITAGGDEYRLEGKTAEELRMYQNREVTVEGCLYADNRLTVNKFESDGPQPSMPPTRQ